MSNYCEIELNATVCNHPQPEIARIDESFLRFHTRVLQGLKPSAFDTHIHVTFRLDVWRFLTKDRGSAANEWGALIVMKKKILIGLPACQIIGIISMELEQRLTFQ